MYTIVQTSKLNDVNPEVYLRDTLAKITEGHRMSRLHELMPWTVSREPPSPRTEGSNDWRGTKHSPSTRSGKATRS